MIAMLLTRRTEDGVSVGSNPHRDVPPALSVSRRTCFLHFGTLSCFRLLIHLHLSWRRQRARLYLIFVFFPNNPQRPIRGKALVCLEDPSAPAGRLDLPPDLLVKLLFFAGDLVSATRTAR
jgi:hypothetical protein